MSFLYARNQQNKIYILSDSKVTISPNDQNIISKNISSQNLESLNKFGIIKNVIINKNLCIGSAGILEHFNELLKFADNKKIDLKILNSKALEIHLKYNQDTDFIIAYTEKKNKKLFVIKNGQIKEENSCWIGSKETFEIFQEYRNNKNNIEKVKRDLQEIQDDDFFYNIIDQNAFEYAIDNTKDESVGGFIVRCIDENGIFKYLESFYTSIERRQKVQLGGTVKLFNNASEGGYTFHIFESTDIFSLYIKQLKKGIRYCCCIKEHGYTNLRFPKLYDIDEEQKFINKFNIKQSIKIIKN